MASFCPCMKSLGVFIQGFVLISLFLAGWESQAAVSMTRLTALVQPTKHICMETSWVLSKAVKPSSGKEAFGSSQWKTVGIKGKMILEVQYTKSPSDDHR